MSDNTVNGFLGSIDTSESPAPKRRRRRGIGIADLESEFLTIGGQAVEETDNNEDGITGMASMQPDPDPVSIPTPVFKNVRQEEAPAKPDRTAQKEDSRKTAPVRNIDAALEKKLDNILKAQKEIITKLTLASDGIKEEIKSGFKGQANTLRKELSQIQQTAPVEQPPKEKEDDKQTVSMEEYEKVLAEKESAIEFTKTAKTTIESLSKQLSEKETEINELNEEKDKLIQENKKMRAAIAGIAAKRNKPEPAPAPSAEQPRPLTNITPLPSTVALEPPLNESAQAPIVQPSVMPVAMQPQPVITPAQAALVQNITPQVVPQAIVPTQMPVYGTSAVQEIPSVWGSDAPPPVSIGEEEPPKKKGFFRKK